MSPSLGSPRPHASYGCESRRDKDTWLTVENMPRAAEADRALDHTPGETIDCVVNRLRCRVRTTRGSLMQLWVVGKPATDEGSLQPTWEFQGVFNTRDKAVDACTGPNHFLFPAILNERLPEETIPSPGT